MLLIVAGRALLAVAGGRWLVAGGWWLVIVRDWAFLGVFVHWGEWRAKWLFCTNEANKVA
jgi:hypothetical protein